MAEQWQFHKGEDVFDSNGQKVGTISDFGTEHLDVSAGFLGIEHLYVPFSEIAREHNDQVFLNVPRDQIRGKGWQQQPTGYASTGQQQYYGTMPSGTAMPGTEGVYAPPVSLPDRLTGYGIYTSDDKEIGKIYDQGPNYVHLRTGLLGLGGELWIPTNCIVRCSTDNQRCYVGVTHDQMKNIGWDKSLDESLSRGCGAAGAGRPAPTEEAAPKGYVAGAPGEQTMPLVEEQIVANRNRAQAGQVDITKDIQEREQSFDVPVTHEEVDIRERPVDRPSDTPPSGKGEIRVPVYEEDVNVEKRPHVYGEVDVSKHQVTEQKHVSGTVRREVPHVEEHGDIEGDVKTEGLKENEPKRKSV